MTSDLEVTRRIRHVVSKLEPYVTVLQLCPDSSVELESRLIYRDKDGRSQDDIPEPYFNQILEFAKRNAKEFAQITPWFDIYNSHFEGSLRFSKTVTKTTDPQTKATVVKEKKIWIKKQHLFTTDLLVPERPLSIRVQLKTEIECEPPHKVLPPAQLLRSQKRCCFTDSLGLQISFSKIWQGVTEDDVKRSTPRRQIEVEMPKTPAIAALPASEAAGMLLTRTLELLGLETAWSICEVSVK